MESIENKRKAIGTLNPPNMDEYTEDLNKVQKNIHVHLAFHPSPYGLYYGRTPNISQAIISLVFLHMKTTYASITLVSAGYV